MIREKAKVTGQLEFPEGFLTALENAGGEFQYAKGTVSTYKVLDTTGGNFGVQIRGLSFSPKLVLLCTSTNATATESRFYNRGMTMFDNNKQTIWCSVTDVQNDTYFYLGQQLEFYPNKIDSQGTCYDDGCDVTLQLYSGSGGTTTFSKTVYWFAWGA